MQEYNASKVHSKYTWKHTNIRYLGSDNKTKLKLTLV